MKTQIENTAKRPYRTPLMEQILLDNEISLALASAPTPPSAPGFEGGGAIGANAPEYFNSDPFRNQQS